MEPNLSISTFGKLPDGREARLFTLTNQHGLVAKVTNYGVILTELHVPDRHGKLADVVLGFDRLEPYLRPHPYFGCIVGRFANRIAHGKFTLEGRTYQLAINNPPNHLHGGVQGFDKKLWKAEPQQGAVHFSCLSPEGDEGYPGNLEVTTVVALTNDNEVRLEYSARCDRSTPVNLTNHTYFNLAAQGDILAHEILISADYYTPSDETLIPTGELSPVRGTPMDFTTARPIGARLAELHSTPPGYDHNCVINRAGKGLALAARVFEGGSGRTMDAYTTQPGMQFYTANYLDGSLLGKGGVVYQRHAGFCLETQHYPDSVNRPSFPSTILHPGQAYHHTTVYRFGTR